MADDCEERRRRPTHIRGVRNQGIRVQLSKQNSMLNT
jgi:hypothetical protein